MRWQTQDGLAALRDRFLIVRAQPGDLADERRNRAGDEKNDDQRIFETAQVLQQQRLLLPFAEHVGPESGRRGFRLGVRQASRFGRRIEPPGPDGVSVDASIDISLVPAQSGVGKR